MGQSGSNLVVDSNNTGRESGFQSPPIPNTELDRAPSNPDRPADERTLVIEENLQHLDFKEVSEPVLKQEDEKAGNWDLKEADEVLEGEKENGPSNWEEGMGGGSEYNGWGDYTNPQVPWIVTDDNGNENETVTEDGVERNGAAFTEIHQYGSLKTPANGFGPNCKFSRRARRKNKAVMEKVKEKEESMVMPGQTECKGSKCRGRMGLSGLKLIADSGWESGFQSPPIPSPELDRALSNSDHPVDEHTLVIQEKLQYLDFKEVSEPILKQEDEKARNWDLKDAEEVLEGEKENGPSNWEEEMGGGSECDGWDDNTNLQVPWIVTDDNENENENETVIEDGGERNGAAFTEIHQYGSLKTPANRFGSNCKFSRRPRRKKKAVMEKVKKKEESMAMPGQTESKVVKEKVKEPGKSTERPVQTECKVVKEKVKKLGKSTERPGQTECKVVKEKVKEPGKSTERPGQTECKVVEEKVKEPGESTERPGQTECKSYLTSGVCKYGRACRYKHTRSKASGTTVLEPNSLDLPMRPTIVFGRFNPVVLKVVEEKVKEPSESIERPGQAECKAVMEKVKEKEESMALPGQTECKDSKCRGRMGLSGLKLIANSNNTGWESGFQSPPIPSHELDRALSDPDHPADEHTLVIQEKLQHLDFEEVSELVLKLEKENGPSNWEEEMGGGSECNGWDDNTNLQVPWIVTDDNWNENETVIVDRGERNGGAFTESHQYRSLETGASRFGSNKFNSSLRRKNKVVMMEKVKKKEESMTMPGQTECKVLFTPIMVVKEKVKEPGKSTERAGQTECKVVKEKVKKPGKSTERPGQTECKVVKEKVKKPGKSTERPGQTECKVVKEKVKGPGKSTERPGQTECKVVKEKVKKPGKSTERPGQTECKVVEEKVKEPGESIERPGQAECKAVMEKVKEKEESMALPGQTECKDSKCRGRMGLSGLKLIANSNNTGWESGFQSPPIPSHELDRALSDPDHPADEHTLVIQEKLQHLDFEEVSELVLKLEKENGPSNWEEEMGGGSECNGWDDNTNLQVPWIVTDDNWNENETVIVDRGERNGGAFTESHQYRSLETGASRFGSNKFNSSLRRKNKVVMMEKVKKKEESMAMPGQTECKVLFTPIMVVKEKVKEPGKSTERAGQTECKVVKEKVKKPGKSTERPGQTECKVVKEKVKKPGKSTERPGQTECKVVKEKVKKPGKSTERPGQTECKVVKEKVKGPGKSTERPGQTECKVVKEKVKKPGKSTERPGQTECKSYLTSGVCKYGRACKHKHTKGKASGTAVLELNFLDLPIRPGAKECPFYMSTGSCKHGANCWFNHPDPLAVDQEDDGGSAASGASSQSSMPSSSPPWTLNVTAPLVPMELSPPHGVPTPNPYGYQAPVYIPEMSMHPTLAEANVYMYHEDQVQVDEYPERPGQPECSRFIKTGACKFKLNCRYHHPKDRIVKSPPCAFSDTGLPLRPDHYICEQYSRYGICKFGQACIFDHPVHPGSGWE
ncbi:uncharacterized protein LOC108984969 isoform X3 [Juglans regia]|uniref:Uncharacterized protein LOC108984969 isoform X3 n=1 Tax=Juglans regia TaxID=51240 RepID=A0A6P9E3J8_JUGRE|nr:uncharacterized protein LOC108984969 isoform X3 [Juglans regia]